MLKSNCSVLVPRLAFVLLVFLLQTQLCVRSALGATVYVQASSSCTSSCGSSDEPYRTLGEAIEAMSTGGEIVVRNGVYSGSGNFNLNVTSANTEIKSESGNPDETIIDCETQGPGLIVRSSTFTMRGITIRNCGSENGGGMHITSTFTRLYDMKFTDNSASNSGGSVYIWSNTVFMYNTTITGSNAKNVGGGVYVESANLQLFNTELFGNSADEGGSQLFCRSASVQLDRDSAIDKALCPECSITYTDGEQFQCSSAMRLNSIWAVMAQYVL